MPNDSDLHEGAHTDAPKEHADAGKGELTRRELIGIAAGAIVASPLARLEITAAANQEQAPHFFSREELEMVEILTDRIIPTDDHSPGARAAGVAAYIDGRLAESWEEQPRKVWRDGLKRVDALCQKMHGQPFLKATPEQQADLLDKFRRGTLSFQHSFVGAGLIGLGGESLQVGVGKDKHGCAFEIDIRADKFEDLESVELGQH